MMLHGSLQFSLYYLERQAHLSNYDLERAFRSGINDGCCVREGLGDTIDHNWSPLLLFSSCILALKCSIWFSFHYYFPKLSFILNCCLVYSVDASSFNKHLDYKETDSVLM